MFLIPLNIYTVQSRAEVVWGGQLKYDIALSYILFISRQNSYALRNERIYFIYKNERGNLYVYFSITYAIILILSNLGFMPDIPFNHFAYVENFTRFANIHTNGQKLFGYPQNV